MTLTGRSCLGHLALSPERELVGWCWYPDAPNERAVVDILLDGALVRSIKATLPRPELRDLGAGDGFYGFDLPLPSTKASDIIIEARERRSGQLFGRIVLGTPASEASLGKRISTLSAALERSFDALKGLDADIGGSGGVFGRFEELGRALMHLSRSRAPTLERHPDLALAAGVDRVADIAAMDLGAAAEPRVAVVLPASGAADLAAALRQARPGLGTTTAEFLLLDDGSDPISALLPARLRGLRVMRVDDARSGTALNAAALATSAEWIAYMDGQDSLNGFALAQGLAGADSRTLHVGSSILDLLGSGCGDLVHAIEQRSFRSGIRSLIHRDAFMELGGFDPAAAGQQAVLWTGFLAKARALGLRVVGWVEPRPFRAVRRAHQ